MSHIPLGPNWDTFYHPGFNCSRVMPPGPEWHTTGEVRPVFGYWSLISGIVAEALYFPCMLALRQESKNSCYKIMFWISLVDMLTLLVCSVFYGVGLLQGDVFCANPIWHFCLGAYGIGCWTASCLGCLILVCNRMAELMDKGEFVRIFSLHYLLSTGFYSLYSRLRQYSIPNITFFFNPYIDNKHEFIYRNIPHAVNNLTVVILSTFLYVNLCIIIFMKQGAMSTDVGRKRIRASRAVFLQAAVICFGNFTSSIMYVYFNFFETPPALIIFGQVAWQLGLSLQPIVYLLVNYKIQKYYFNLIGLRRKVRKSTGTASPSRRDSRRPTVVSPIL